jgi:CHAD domain-containing protein
MENEPKPETDDAQAAQPPEESPTRPDSHRALQRLLDKRVKKFLKLAADVRGDADAKTIHDVRVWSRRLQQAVSAFFPKPRTGKVRRLRRIPRRIRRAVGEWRNCDVLLEAVARQKRHTRSDAKRKAWDLVRAYLVEKRNAEVARAEKKLAREDLEDYQSLSQRLVRDAPQESSAALLERLHANVGDASTKWQQALARAQETRTPEDLHRFRITTKALRYRIELLCDVGDKPFKPQLKSLAGLQDALGSWHDRKVLSQTVAEAIARPEVLLGAPQNARILLAQLEKERGRENQEIEEIIRRAAEYEGATQMQINNTQSDGSTEMADEQVTPGNDKEVEVNS